MKVYIYTEMRDKVEKSGAVRTVYLRGSFIPLLRETAGKTSGLFGTHYAA